MSFIPQPCSVANTTVEITNDVGNPIPTAANTTRVEDTPHTTADNGEFILAVRNDNGVTNLTDTNGDYSPIAADVKGRVFTTTAGCSITNGAETAVSSVAVQIVASGVGRKGLFIQNNGTGDVRIGATGVTATTGIKLIPGDSIILTGGATPVNAVFAIRSAAVDSIVLAQELI